MKPANCGCPQSASLLPVDHNHIIGYRVKVNVRYVRFQYNTVNCKVSIVWFILCQRLQPVSGTVKGECLTAVMRVQVCKELLWH